MRPSLDCKTPRRDTVPDTVPFHLFRVRDIRVSKKPCYSFLDRVLIQITRHSLLKENGPYVPSLPEVWYPNPRSVSLTSSQRSCLSDGSDSLLLLALGFLCLTSPSPLTEVFPLHPVYHYSECTSQFYETVCQ